MARTIDERIVQMTFNNQEFENRARTTISTLGKLKSTTDSLSGDWLANIGKSIANSGLQSLTVTTSKISEGFSALEQIAIGALRNIGAKAEQLGTKLIKSLTIDNISGGWSKYVDLTGSVQTLINSTGQSVDEIDEKLERLMWYSDETSFGFADMTKALGTMVSSGGDIETLIPMIMGIGNATAYAGKGAAEFQRVIYNLNQSYSSGALNTMDWKSIELAGVDSKMLKQQLLDAAVELKVINKEAAKLENFKDLLSKKVFTRDVMEKAFGNFAEFTLEVEKLVADGVYETASDAMEALTGKYEKFSEDSFVAAQSAKSFKEAIEATQDAVSSGWMQSFKLIFGNYEESKALWTDVTGSLWDWFASGAESRNKVLKEWKTIWTSAVEAKKTYDSLDDRKKQNVELDGFYIDVDDSLTQVQSLWKAFSNVINDIRDTISATWNEVFDVPEISQIARSLFDFLEKIRSSLNHIHYLFNEALPKDGGFVTSFTSALNGLFSILRSIMTIGKEIINSFIKPLGERFKPILKDIAQIITNIGNILYRTGFDIINDLTPLQKVLNGILDILDPIINGIATFVGWIKDLTSQNGEITVFSGLFKTIGDIFEFVGKAVKGTVNVFSTVGKALGDIFENIKGTIGNFLESNGTNVAKIAEGGFLGYLAIVLTKIIAKLKKIDISDAIGGIIDFFKGENKGFISAIKETFETLTDSIKSFTEGIKVKMLDVISNSLLKLAAALLIISLVDSSKIADSLGVMGVMLAEVVGALAVMNKIDAGKGFNKTAAAFDQIAAGMILMAISLKMISSADPQQMLKTLAILGIALAEVVAFMAILNEMNPDKIGVAAKAFKKISIGLLLLSIALKIISSIKPERMISTLTLLGGSLLGLMGFFVITSKMINDSSGKKMESMGKALTNMGVGLIALSIALKIMASINTEEMSQALMGLILSLAAIGLFMGAMGKFVGGANFVAIAGGMLILSVALIGLGAALAIMGKMKLATIGKGLLAMAGALTVIGVAGLLLGPIAPLILLLSVAIGGFGLALSAAAKGILEFMAAYTLMQAMGPNFASALIDVFEQAVAAVIMILPMLIAGIIDAIIQTDDKFVDLVINLLDVIIKAVTEALPRIIELGIQIVMAFLTGIRDNIQQFATVSLEIIGGLINGLADGLPQLFDALFNLVVTAIDGLAEAIRNNAGAYGTAVGNLASALVGGIGTALWNAPKAFATNIWDGITNLFGGGDTSKLESSGAEVTNAYMKGMESKSSELNKQTDSMSDKAVDQLEKKSEANTAGYNTAGGYIQGAKNQMTNVYNTFYSVGSEAIRGMKDGAKVRSPSRLAMEVGAYIIEGLANGMEENAKMANDAGRSTGLMVIDALSTAIDAANSILEDDLNPVITPVLDLSNVEGNAGAISDLMSANASLNGALAANPYGQNPFNQNGEKQVNVSVNFTVNNAGRDLSDSDVKRFGRQIANEVNEVLGGMVA